MNKKPDCRRAYLKRLTTACAGLVLASILSATAYARGNNFQSLAANVNGVKIHYLKAGTGKRPLVLIHGFGDTSHMWVPLFDEFGKDFTIIAPDLRGLGDSSRPVTGYDKWLPMMLPVRWQEWPSRRR